MNILKDSVRLSKLTISVELYGDICSSTAYVCFSCDFMCRDYDFTTSFIVFYHSELHGEFSR